MKILKNLLPDDTRIIEVVTAGSVVLAASVMLLGDPSLLYSNTILFIGMVVGFIQLVSLMVLDKLEACRVYASLLTGGFLLYLGIAHIGDTYTFNYISQITLGCANLYAFLVNNQRLVWK